MYLIVYSHSLTLICSNLGFSGLRCRTRQPLVVYQTSRRRRKVAASSKDVNDFDVFDSSLEENFDDENVEQDANTVFAKLLQSQLEIVVTATNAESAAMFVDAGNSADVGSMLMVCCYPPEGQDNDFDTSLGEQPLPGEARYSIPSPYRRIAGDSSSVVTLGILQTMSSPKQQQYSSDSSSSSHDSYNDRVCSSVARSLGVSIVMEMVTYPHISSNDTASHILP